MIEVLIVAPYASVLAGLRAMLSEFGNIGIVGEARDSMILVHMLETLTPSAILYDSGAGDLNAVLAALSGRRLPIVTLSDGAEDIQALAGGAEHGWCALHRSAGGEEIAAGLQAAVAGLVALDPVFAETVLAAPPPDRSSPNDHDAADPVLTARELEVLQLMTHGLPNKNIASRLHISLSTAKFHVASILSKLDAESRTEAVTIGARKGLVSL